jgi:tagatose 6-phosphate kinase
VFLCVSPNPAIDKRMRVSSLTFGRVNRARSVESFPGGKATHVAMVLHTLGESPAWIGPCGGATGTELMVGLSSLGIRAQVVSARHPTRTNLEIIEDCGKVTEILEPGAPLPESALTEFFGACKSAFAKDGERLSVIFSGSLPADTSPDLYAQLIATANTFGCHTFLDTGGEPLRTALGAHPQFIKPNREEAASALGRPIISLTDAAAALRELILLGACSAALSFGADGLLFCAGKDSPLFFAPAVKLRPISTVGCGDSALAGFAHALARQNSPEDALRLAAACAAANCLANSPGAARRADIEKFLGDLSVRKIENGN